MASGLYTARAPPPPPIRSLSSQKTPMLLPDIAEHSPPLEPTRTPSPHHRPALRSVSVASFLSDGTIEIEGFGFDLPPADDDGASTIFGDEESVYDGDGAPDLSSRAERILANAKKKLDQCGQNISRARDSMVMSPTTGPRLDTQLRWKFNNRNSVEVSAVHGGHLRTSSESAVHSIVGMRSYEILANVPEEHERPASEMGRRKSTQQMRVLRDQMKDLRGKITNLQAQAKTDTIRRRQSVSSLRSSYDDSNPMLEEIQESRVINLKNPPDQDEWTDVLPLPAVDDDDLDDDDYEDERSSTPRARHEEVMSPYSERHEDRSDAFSYDSLLIGNSFVSYRRPTSKGSEDSAATILQPPVPLQRNDSTSSISSYATAAEGRGSPSEATVSSGLSSPGLHYTSLRPPPPPARDDGYHSAPQTPQERSWFRDSAQPDPVPVKSERSAVSLALRDSHTVIMAGGKEGDVELRVGKEDRVLIEGVIEALGKVCAAMEVESLERTVLRERLRRAMRVLDGAEDEGVEEMF